MKTPFYIFFLFAIITIGLRAQNLYDIVVRDDNDIATFCDTLSPREVMPADLKTHISDLIALRCKELGEDCDLKNIYIQTFKIDYDDNHVLYVTELYEGQLGFQIYLTTHNISANTYSDSFHIDGKFMHNNEEGFEAWNGRLIQKPYITLSDLDSDGKKEILFQRRAHNGTWNAVETIAIKFNEGDGLKKFFSFYSKELKETGTETMIMRKIKSVKNGRITLGVTANDMTFHIDNEMPDETITITK